MEPATKKQRTSDGGMASPGTGAEIPEPQEREHTKKTAPDFELPVASIVRLVKRVSFSLI
jgi:hypothetical protein